MKSGDTVVVRIDGVTYRGTVKRAFVSPFGVPSVWIEWPKGVDPSPSRTFGWIFHSTEKLTSTMFSSPVNIRLS
jgi:hypothetical protein